MLDKRVTGGGLHGLSFSGLCSGAASWKQDGAQSRGLESLMQPEKELSSVRPTDGHKQQTEVLPEAATGPSLISRSEPDGPSPPERDAVQTSAVLTSTNL